MASTVPRRATATLVVGTFNVHAGVDGWGRPWDVVGACREIDADVLVLEETWSPADGPGTAELVARAMGYEVRETALASGRLAPPHPDADARWMRPFDWRGSSHAIYLDSELPFRDAVQRSARFRGARLGSWGVAVLSRLPVRTSGVVDLGRLARDRARRAAILVEIGVGDETVTIAGTHMSHLTYGAPVQFRRLARALEPAARGGRCVLAGDMNLWGPPLAMLLPSWRRAVRRPTWPAWRPHSQVDHVLVRGDLAVLDAEVLPMAGSDHRPLRVTFGLGDARED